MLAVFVVDPVRAADKIGQRPQTTAPNEIRGTSIQGGARQALKAGDVVHVAAGTPHQVVDTSHAFDYVVLKVDSP